MFAFHYVIYFFDQIKIHINLTSEKYSCQVFTEPNVVLLKQTYSVHFPAS